MCLKIEYKGQKIERSICCAIFLVCFPQTYAMEFLGGIGGIGVTGLDKLSYSCSGLWSSSFTVFSYANAIQV